MRKYKLALLLKSGVKKEKKESILKDIKKWIGVVKEEKLNEIGEKKLAYPIKKEKSAEYLVFNFEAEKISSGLDKKILMQEDILRHLLIREK